MFILKVLLAFVRLADAKLIAFCNRVHDALTGNPNFPTPAPTLAEIKALIDDFTIALSNAADGGRTLTAIKNEKRWFLIAGMRKLILYVLANGLNNEAILLSSGFDISTGSRNTKPLPYTPGGLILDYGEISGTVDAESNPAEYAIMYEFRYTEDAYGPDARWIYLPLTTRPKTLFTGITPGKSIWGQVRSVNGKGVSNWSDPANLPFIR